MHLLNVEVNTDKIICYKIRIQSLIHDCSCSYNKIQSLKMHVAFTYIACFIIVETHNKYNDKSNVIIETYHKYNDKSYIIKIENHEV